VDVSERLGCSREAARLKLHELHDADLLEKKKVGAGAVVWWAIENPEPVQDINTDSDFWDVEPGKSEDTTDASDIS
ncbi:MAG: ArsR family transcriptional regulator, partial [Halobacteria archaeon]|nr:ArsR family transcriptional regulator [Halobacteria archaeon]